ncbi:hypothetical protein KFL_001660200 [Klebsormidium nitens]|uniref:K Homology domain-containing protein n=1 Tax=Klebsormidium nitens TaxID=105231 RepID=A0A1Y1HZ15_KLENI|nr:hypothetical protein KFL_001660200 [Klebsormidium nitens]|eukprot:GAQ83885.1 hypothetical protein KFL_001660200 [Klebsormidium nitens]
MTRVGTGIGGATFQLWRGVARSEALGVAWEDEHAVCGSGGSQSLQALYDCAELKSSLEPMSSSFHGHSSGLSADYGSRQTEMAGSASERYLAILLLERQKLAPFVEVLPNCSRLLQQEIARVAESASLFDTDSLTLDSVLSRQSSFGAAYPSPGTPRTPDSPTNWPAMSPEGYPHQSAPSPSGASGMGWSASQGSLAQGPVVKRSRKVEVPVDKYPNYNFVGRILGPRGNSLKRIEAGTGCKVLIRGRGSIKDQVKEEKMRDKPGFEHLKEPLHVHIEAEMPLGIVDAQLSQAVEIIHELIKPVDESNDQVKKAQLRELAYLNGTLRVEGGGPSLSPARVSMGMLSAEMKRLRREPLG